MELQPQGDWILVLPLPEERETESGLLFPEEARREIWKKGKVLKVGTGKVVKKGSLAGTRVRPDVHEGDVVRYLFALEKTHSGIQLRSTLGEAFLIQEKDIVGVEEDGSF